MKHTKRMLAILMTLAMVLSMTFAMSAVSFAAEGDEEGDTPAATAYDSKVTVTGLDDGDIVNFYQIVEWVGSADGNVGGWKAVAPFNNYLTEDKLTEILKGTPAVEDDPDTPEDESKPAVEPGITSDIAGRLAQLITSSTPKTAVTAEDGKAELTIPTDPSKEGIYMGLITPKNPDVVYNPVFVSSDYDSKNSSDTWAITENKTYSDEAAAKKSTVELKKTASTAEDSWDDKKWNTTAIGDTVSFTVETTIPGYGKVYTDPVFIIRDKLTDLELVEGSVTVVSPADLTEDQVTIAEADDGSGYTITFSADYMKTCAVPTDVEVKYDAIVTTTAPVHVNTEKNEVSTEFSHDPSNESDHGFKKDTTQHYTFTIDAEGLGGGESQEGQKTSELVKIGLDADGKPITDRTETSTITKTETWESPLAEAKFKLYTDAAATNEYIPKKDDGTPGTALNIKSGEDGRMKIEGLDAGTYYLKEVEAPAGFVADTTVHKIEISATTKEVTVTEYTKDGVTWISADAYDALEDKTGYKSYTYKTDVLDTYTVKIDGEETAIYHFTNKGTDSEIIWTETPPVEHPFQIKNFKGTELPSTGGIGTIIFYVLGTILVLGCGIVLISKRRLNGNK